MQQTAGMQAHMIEVIGWSLGTRSQLNPDKPGQSGLYLRPVSFEKILRIGQSRPGHESNSYSSDRLFAI
jgi:hypothetical protein